MHNQGVLSPKTAAHLGTFKSKRLTQFTDKSHPTPFNNVHINNMILKQKQQPLPQSY